MICEASKKKLNIMIDLHGVSDRMPELIKPMMKTFRACGHTVIICSGPKLNKILKELEYLGYEQEKHYDKVISVVDFLENRGIVFVEDERGPWTSDEIWFKSKGDIAREVKADIVIDDSIQYKENMPKSTAFWLWN